MEEFPERFTTFEVLMKAAHLILAFALVVCSCELHAKSDDPKRLNDPIKIKKDSVAMVNEPDTTVTPAVFFPNPFIQLFLTPPEEKTEQDPGM